MDKGILDLRLSLRISSVLWHSADFLLIRRLLELNSQEFLVFIALCSLMETDSAETSKWTDIKTSYERIAELTDLPKKSVKAYINKLVSKGIVEKKNGMTSPCRTNFIVRLNLNKLAKILNSYSGGNNG